MTNRSFSKFAPAQGSNPFDEPDNSLQQVTNEIYGRSDSLPFKPRMKADPNAIIPQEGGGFVYKRFSMSPIGMVLPEDASGDEWEEVGWALKAIDGAIAWWVGDWAQFAMRNWNWTAAQVAERFDYTTETIETYAWVCGGIPGSIRNRAVFFSHHRHIAKMDEWLQRSWLEYADFFIRSYKLKVAEFKQDIAALDFVDTAERIDWMRDAMQTGVRLSQNPKLQPPALLPPPLPTAVIRGKKSANQAMKALVNHTDGRITLSAQEIQEKGRAVIEWAQKLMEASK